jgi:hypothetical protein
VGNTKNFFKYFFKIKEYFAILDRFIPTREALVYFVMIYEVKDLKNDLLQTFKAF